MPDKLLVTAEGDRMRRREFITLLGSAAAWPLAARAQQPGGRADATSRNPKPVLWRSNAGCKSWAGYRVAIFRSTIAGAWARLRRRAATADLLKLTPSVLIAVASPATAAMQRTTRTIPIVFVAVSELVAQGLVASLAHPGGNLQPARQFQRRRSWRPAGEPIRPPALAVDRAQAKISSNSQT